MFSEGSFSLDDVQRLEAANKIMIHILNVKEYAPSVKNIYVGILRYFAQNNSLSAITFGESYQEIVNDDRALKALVQAHGKCGNFSKPLQYLKKMPKSSWRTTQESKFKSASRILEKGLKIKIPKSELIQSNPKSIIYLSLIHI